MFRLAHLSDVHLAPVPWPQIGELGLKSGLGLANWHRKRKRMHRRDVLDALVFDMKDQRPDHIAVGGDIVNAGLPAEIRAAREWLGGLGPPEQVTVVPGNHDVYSASVGAGLSLWRPYLGGNGDSVGGDPQFPFVRHFGQIALICLSSAVPTPVFSAVGRLGAPQLAKLATLLAEFGTKQVFRIVLLHHPPLPGQASRYRGLEDAAQMAEVLGQHGAELVLHGHNHQSTLRWVTSHYGRVPVVGVASSSAVPGIHVPPARYNLFEIERAQEEWRVGLVGREYLGGGRMAEAERLRLAG